MVKWRIDVVVAAHARKAPKSSTAGKRRPARLRSRAAQVGKGGDAFPGIDRLLGLKVNKAF